MESEIRDNQNDKGLQNEEFWQWPITNENTRQGQERDPWAGKPFFVKKRQLIASETGQIYYPKKLTQKK